jgi:hypothetical protein
MSFRAGDRIRFVTTADDGLPLVRYGFVGGVTGSEGPVVIMLDGEISGDVVSQADIEHVAVTTVELRLQGSDLVEQAELRRGLVHLWQAEADSAGLDVDALHPMGDGERDGNGCWALARLIAGGQEYVVTASQIPQEPGMVRVRADGPAPRLT